MDESEELIGTEERCYDDDRASSPVLLLHLGREMEWYAWRRVLRGLFWFTGVYDGVEMFSMSLRRMGEMGLCVCRGRGRWRGEVRFWDGEGICLSGSGMAVLEQGAWEIGVTVYGYAVVMGIWMSAEECIERFKIFDH